MAKNSKKDSHQKERRRRREDEDYRDELDEDSDMPRGLSRETICHAAAIALLGLSALLLLAALGRAGRAGELAYHYLSYFLGAGYFLLPAGSILGAVALFRTARAALSPIRLIGAVIIFPAGFALFELIVPESGGVFGALLARSMSALFERLASIVILFALALISLLVIFDTRLPTSRIAALARNAAARLRRHDVSEEETYTITGISDDETASAPDGGAASAQEESAGDLSRARADAASGASASAEGGAKTARGAAQGAAAANATGAATASRASNTRRRTSETESESEPDIELRTLVRAGRYAPPPISILEKDRGKPGVGDIKANTNIIKRTLANFGITVEMDEVSIGPTVTRYALKPAEGVKLSRIIGLKNELALALAAHPIRIEAPIPGHSLVGIEIPNTAKSTVGLANLIGAEEFILSDKPLFVVLGKSISGKAHFASISKMPHLLIAGATGSGKSVAIHSLVTSLLFRNAPEHLRIIMIDPKRVELTLYNDIPHLQMPVVTNPRQAILALRWAAKEMDRRYELLESEKVRDIESYHRNIVAPAYADAAEAGEHELMGEGFADTPALDDTPALPERMPYIVIVMDELADIMAMYPRELEAAIVRLAQMSRAIGIHLVLSTQRPSVNVITGLIKANIPTRIAFQVASQVDSRTILDSGGAETLLGAGDMLYLAGDMAKPLRLQSAFVSETEVKNVVRHIVNNYDALPPEQIALASENADTAGFTPLPLDEIESGEDEQLYEQAREIIVRAGKASTSLLQRRLRLGYARAARLVDMLEERGVVGPADGAKPRDILMGGGADGADEREHGET
jgi:S-DNA-T family DNA segregation ATPase FtsK/SpoIIIE